MQQETRPETVDNQIKIISGEMEKEVVNVMNTFLCLEDFGYFCLRHFWLFSLKYVSECLGS